MQLWQYRLLVTARLLQGLLSLHYVQWHRPWTSLLDIYHPDPRPVAATTVFSTPDDGHRKRPKHVEQSCSDQ